MTENQYQRANKMVLSTVLIVFGYIALTVLAAIGISKGQHAGKMIVEVITAVVVIMVSVIAYITKKKTRTCELILSICIAVGYVIIILLNSVDGVWTYGIPLIISVIVYLNKRLMYCANGVVIAANIVRLMRDFDSRNSDLLTSRILAILVMILIAIISINIADILIKYFTENVFQIQETSAKKNELIDETEKTFVEVGNTMDVLMSSIHVAEQSINKILDSTSVISDNISHLSATGEEVAAASAEGIKVSDSTVEGMNDCKIILNNIYELANELKASVETKDIY